MSSAESSTVPPETKIKPLAPQTKRWADEEDDPVEDSKPSSSTSALESIVEDLKIDENKKINKFLDEPEDSNIKAATSGETPYSWASSFEDLKLSPELLKGLYVEMKFQKPSKLQAISLPMILNSPYKDLIAQADNGSGKTTCLVLGMLSRVDPNLKAPQAFCICPTRELAMQNKEVVQKMGKHTGLTIECVVPTDSSQFTNHIPINKRAPLSAHIVVGTPGTIKRWYSAKKLALNNVKMLVFDEADHMQAEDNFKDDSLRMKKYIEESSRHCQVLLFSATFNETLNNFVAKILQTLLHTCTLTHFSYLNRINNIGLFDRIFNIEYFKGIMMLRYSVFCIFILILTFHCYPFFFFFNPKYNYFFSKQALRINNKEKGFRALIVMGIAVASLLGSANVI
ncbi:hypothetical protein UlMin_033528 [Ulmus minor]